MPISGFFGNLVISGKLQGEWKTISLISTLLPWIVSVPDLFSA